MRPPTTGKIAQTTASFERRVQTAGDRTARYASVVAAPIAAAGAGPSSTIARTTAKNAPETRRPRISTVIDVAGDRQREEDEHERKRLPVGSLRRQHGSDDRRA